MNNRFTQIIKVLVLSMALAVPYGLSAQDVQHAQTEQEANPVSVTVNGSTLRIKNAEGCVVEIFSLTGEAVYSSKIESQSKAVDVSHLQKGYYIVKVGKFTRKVYIP